MNIQLIHNVFLTFTFITHLLCWLCIVYVLDNKLVNYLLIICTLFCVILLCFIELIILYIIGQKGQTPLQAAEKQLQKDLRDRTKEPRSRIISYLKGLDENVRADCHTV